MEKEKIEKMEKEIKELTRRIDTLAMRLFASDSKYGLHQFAELKKRLENQEIRTSMNDTSLRILLYTVQGLQRLVYPISEIYEKHKARKKLMAKARRQNIDRERNV